VQQYSGEIIFFNKPCVNCGATDDFITLSENIDLRINRTVKTVICKTCSLTFLNPSPTPDSYRKFYEQLKDSKIPSKEKIINHEKNHEFQLCIKFIQDSIGSLKEMDAVDVGSGHGGFLHYLKPNVKSLVCAELSDGVQESIPKYFGCKVFQTGTLGESFPQNNFDLITSIAVIEHYDNPLEALRDYYRTLKEGGYIFLNTPDVINMCFEAGVEKKFKFIHPFYFSVKTLSSLVLQAGFSEIKYYVSDLSFKYRSLIHPTLVAPGRIFLIAKKDTSRKLAPNKFNLKDSPDELLKIYQNAIKREKEFNFKMKFLLLKRIINKVFPKPKLPSMYKIMYDQYNAAEIKTLD